MIPKQSHKPASAREFHQCEPIQKELSKATQSRPVLWMNTVALAVKHWNYMGKQQKIHLCCMYHSMSMEQKHCSITSCNSFSSLQKVIAFHLAFSFSSCANLSIHAFAVAFMSFLFMSFHFLVMSFFPFMSFLTERFPKSIPTPKNYISLLRDLQLNKFWNRALSRSRMGVLR